MKKIIRCTIITDSLDEYVRYYSIEPEEEPTVVRHLKVLFGDLSHISVEESTGEGKRVQSMDDLKKNVDRMRAHEREFEKKLEAMREYYDDMSDR